MSQIMRYERILSALGGVSCDVAELGDRDIAAKLRELQVMAVDRLYALSDHSLARDIRVKMNGEAAKLGRRGKCRLPHPVD